MKSQNGADLRQRRVPPASTNPATTTPAKAPSPRLFYEESPVPGAKKRWNGSNDSHDSNGGSSQNGGGSRDTTSSDDGGSLPMAPIETTGGPRKEMSRDQVKKDESRKKKILVRVVYGACMFAVFAGSVRNPREQRQVQSRVVRYLTHLIYPVFLPQRCAPAMYGSAYWYH